MDTITTVVAKPFKLSGGIPLNGTYSGLGVNPLTGIRDNKVYATFQIGTQCWMQAKLDFGMTIHDFTPQTDNCIVE